jgi:hypothetical protein
MKEADMQRKVLWLGRKLSLCLLAVVAVLVATSSARAGLAPIYPVPETSGGSAELLAVLGLVSVALILRMRKTKELTRP